MHRQVTILFFFFACIFSPTIFGTVCYYDLLNNVNLVRGKMISRSTGFNVFHHMYYTIELFMLYILAFKNIDIFFLMQCYFLKRV